MCGDGKEAYREIRTKKDLYWDDCKMTKYIRIFCGYCPDVSKCTIAKDLTAIDRCSKVKRNYEFLESLDKEKRQRPAPMPAYARD